MGRTNPDRRPVEPKEFVRAWQMSENIVEVCSRIGVSRQVANARAAYYRKNGVSLQHFARRRFSHIDYEELARYAATLMEKA